jgi:hypothetical protein
MRSNGLYIFKNSFDHPCPLRENDTLKNNNSSCLFHNLLCMDVVSIFVFHFIIGVSQGIFGTTSKIFKRKKCEI